ncbi:MAG TPA: hypothetical protein VM778_03835, partial [Gemmatimonadota bacterium]|nr:hypothetical protein [Gemmatimonadota bacterium]
MNGAGARARSTVFRPAGPGALIGLAALAAIACDTKGGGFFRPGTDPAPDVSPPIFSDARPGPGVEILSADRIFIEVVDPSPGGAAPSGIDPASIEVTVAGGDPLIAILDLPTITIDLGSLADGPVQIIVVARDRAGNQSTHIFDFTLDRTPPPIVFVSLPPPQIATSLVTLAATVQAQVGPEPHYQSGQLEVRTPGADNQCGTADDGVPPASVVAQPTRPL